MEAASGASTLKRYREAAKMSQEDLAASVGKTDGAVWQWENGRTTPRRAVAMRLDQLLKANGEILSSFGYAQPGPAEPDDELISRLDVRYAPMGMAESGLAALERLTDELERLKKRVARLEAEARPRKRPASG